jgi:uncharacterized protein YbaA (DUF1428 family)
MLRASMEVQMAYVDVMVLPFKAENLKAYKKLVRDSAKAWKRNGAIGYHEMVEDDVKPGKVTSFPQSVKLKEGEKVACAYIIFKTKAHRNQVWKKIMKDPFMTGFDPKNMPFDAKRMFFGGFKTLVSF